MLGVLKKIDWQPPSGWRRIQTIDAHTAGEPFRVIVGGIPELRGDSILDRRRWAREHLEHVRRGLMWEPRGHADMYGCIVTPPVSENADFGVLFLHNDGYSTMCGHGILAITKIAIDTGLVPAREPVTTLHIDTPAGPVTARAEVTHRTATALSFENVDSWVVELDAVVVVPELGPIHFDLAYGGAFYAVVDAAEAGVSCSPAHTPELVACGRAIKKAVAATTEIVHPTSDDLGFLYGVIFVEPTPATSGVHSRNVCVFADGEVDRSPTGTGVSARLAILYARGEVALGQRIVIESLIGSRFGGTVVRTTAFGNYEAIVPRIDGSAHITGRHEFVFDPADELGEGFLVR